MVRISLCLAVMAMVSVVPQVAEGQSPEMPEPQLVLLDADGKPMVQVVDISGLSVVALFDFDGVPARFSVDVESGFRSGSGVAFSEPNCVGKVYLSVWAFGVWEVLTQKLFTIIGPHPDDGTYRVFRSTSLDFTTDIPASVWSSPTSGFGECVPYTGGGPGGGRVPAEEILPNPLFGFHGPTAANPDRRFSVKGGTRLP